MVFVDVTVRPVARSKTAGKIVGDDDPGVALAAASSGGCVFTNKYMGGDRQAGYRK
jgi:hypothetical protein